MTPQYRASEPRVLTYHLFRVGEGDDMTFEIRKVYTEFGEIVAYLAEPVTPKAKTVDDLRKVLEHMVGCLDKTPIKPDKIIELPQEPWGKY